MKNQIESDEQNSCSSKHSRQKVILQLFQSARKMEPKMNQLFLDGDLIAAEVLMQAIQGIYSRITDAEYKFCAQNSIVNNSCIKNRIIAV